MTRRWISVATGDTEVLVNAFPFVMLEKKFVGAFYVLNNQRVTLSQFENIFNAMSINYLLS